MQDKVLEAPWQGWSHTASLGAHHFGLDSKLAGTTEHTSPAVRQALREECWHTMQELPEDKGEALAPLPSNWVALCGFILPALPVTVSSKSKVGTGQTISTVLDGSNILR